MWVLIDIAKQPFNTLIDVHLRESANPINTSSAQFYLVDLVLAQWLLFFSGT